MENPQAPKTPNPKPSFPSATSKDELFALIEKQGQDIAEIRSLIAHELGRQKMRRFVKFIYHFVLIAAVTISLVATYVFINEQIKAFRAFTDKIGNQADSIESFTRDSVEGIENSINKFNIFE